VGEPPEAEVLRRREEARQRRQDGVDVVGPLDLVEAVEGLAFG
jgi:hypothetical protein